MQHSPFGWFYQFAIFAFAILVGSCRNIGPIVMTVNGEVPVADMGITLPQEHLVMQTGPIDSVNLIPMNKDSLMSGILPFLAELKPYHVGTLIDGTPEFMGRDPILLADLSRLSGINIITNTGWDGTDNGKHLPQEIKDLTAEEIALIWIDEARHGIGNSGIKPGYIKIGISQLELAENDRKLVSAAALTHLATGLTILSAAGPARAAYEQLKVLRASGVSPSAFIWSNAMMEMSYENVMSIAEKGVWVMFDGVQADMNAMIKIAGLVKFMKSVRLLDHVMLSQNGGWYDPSRKRGGHFVPYTELFSSFYLLLLSEGITRDEIHQMMVVNPAKAFAVELRKN